MGCVCLEVIVVVALSSIFACGGSFWVCMVVIVMALDRVSLTFVCNCCLLVLVVSCWSSSSRMICGRGVGAGGVSGVRRSGME